MKNLFQLIKSLGAPKLFKAPSKIQGIGIFTDRDIKQGKGFYEIPLDVILRKPTPGCAYIWENRWVSDERVLNYVNHSCDPNTDFITRETPHLRSIRPITAGEEITVDYNKTEKRGTEVPCNCQSPNCRGSFLRKEK